MARRFPVVRDIIERVASTFGAATLAAWITSGAGWQESLHFDSWRTYALAGVAAVVSAVKGAAATRIGRTPSASLDPAVELAPTGATDAEPDLLR